MIDVREALITDVEGLVDVNVKTWQSAYKGIINDDTLESLDKNRKSRIERFKQDFGIREVDGEIIKQAVALNDDKVIGFVSYGKCRDSKELELLNSGEIYAIYVLPEYQGNSIGRKLLNYAVNHINVTAEYERVLIWTLRANPNRGFYEHFGGVLKFNKIIEIGGQSLEEVGYIYDNIINLKDKTE